MEESHICLNIAARLGHVGDAYSIPAEKRIAVDIAYNMVVCVLR